MDKRMLHAAEPAEDTKWVSQIWIRQANFEGTTGRADSSDDEGEGEEQEEEEAEEEDEPPGEGGAEEE